MARFIQLDRFLHDLRHRMELEHDPLVNEGLRHAIQITDLLGQVVDSLVERDRLLHTKFKAVVKAVDHDDSAADIIRKSAFRILSSEASQPPDLLGAWTDAVSLKSKRDVLQLWFATEAFAFACYRQAIAQQLQLLTYGILLSTHDAGDWPRLERSVAALIVSAGAASPVAQRARNDKNMERQVGGKLCSGLEALAGIAAANHVLTVEWKPSVRSLADREDTYTRLDRLFPRSEAWLNEVVNLLQVPVGYRPSPEIESAYS